MTQGLFCSKLNSSIYHGEPFELEKKFSKNLHYLSESDSNYLWDDTKIISLSTPGHTIDSFTLNISNYIFSGDALIPGILSSYRKKPENFNIEIESASKICSSFDGNYLLCPGHGREYKIEDIKNVNSYNPLDIGLGFKCIS